MMRIVFANAAKTAALDVLVLQGQQPLNQTNLAPAVENLAQSIHHCTQTVSRQASTTELLVVGNDWQFEHDVKMHASVLPATGCVTQLTSAVGTSVMPNIRGTVPNVLHR